MRLFQIKAILTGLTLGFCCHGEEPYAYLRSTNDGQMEINLERVEAASSRNSDQWIKGYLPVNVTARDSQSQVTQKFLSRGFEQFEKTHKEEFAATIQTIKAVNQTSSSGLLGTNVRFEFMALQGKGTFVHDGIVRTAVSFQTAGSTSQLEFSKYIMPHTKVSFIQSSNSLQTLSKMTLAYDF